MPLINPLKMKQYFAKITNNGHVREAWTIEAESIHEARTIARKRKDEDAIDGFLVVRSRVPGPTASREMLPFNAEIYKLNQGGFETGQSLMLDNFETIDSAIVECHERIPFDWMFYKIVVYKEQEEVYCQEFTNS